MERRLKLSDFDFPVPETLVAQEPARDRSGSRLLVRRRDGTQKHARFRDLSEELPAGSLLIFNDTRVFAGRLKGRLPSGGGVELLLLRDLGEGCWQAMARPLKKLKPGLRLTFPEDVGCTVEAVQREAGAGTVQVTFDLKGSALDAWIDRVGFIPLPPYIRRDDGLPAPASPDADRYQTVYARERGSVAAPTAGLHFAEDVLNQLEARGIKTANVCLHVGAGTFLPVKEEDPANHVMHTERFRVPKATLDAISDALAQDHPIIAVGTTTLRSLESFARLAAGHPRPGEDPPPASELERLADTWLETDLFIRPETESDRVRPWAVSALLTNFHQPCSTLFMLVCALIGWREAHALYQEAMRHEYRLFSYGDANLLWL